MDFSYDFIETQIIEALPELKPAADTYAELEGKPSKDSGAYIFFENVFATYVEVLLVMAHSPGRDHLLSRAFNLVEEMLKSKDQEVNGLAFIGIFEGRELWFYSKAMQFLGSVARKELDAHEPRWRETIKQKYEPERDVEIIDLYCVREVVVNELLSEEINRERIPGVTYPQKLKKFLSLADARTNNEAVVFLSCFGTTFPYVVCPPDRIACSEPKLYRLTQDLAEIDNQEPNQKLKANVMFLRIPMGERVWNMNQGSKKHIRYHGKLWIADKFNQLGLSKSIKEILSNKRDFLLK